MRDLIDTTTINRRHLTLLGVPDDIIEFVTRNLLEDYPVLTLDQIEGDFNNFFNKIKQITRSGYFVPSERCMHKYGADGAKEYIIEFDSKDRPISLNDLIFPSLSETIEYGESFKRRVRKSGWWEECIYDPDGRVVYTHDSDGQLQVIKYTEKSKYTYSQNVTGSITNLFWANEELNDDGLTVYYNDSNGKSWEKRYYDNGELEYDHNLVTGSQNYYYYNPRGNLISKEGLGGYSHVLDYNYHENHQLKSIVDTTTGEQILSIPMI
jgi:hypothetical protein